MARKLNRCRLCGSDAVIVTIDLIGQSAEHFVICTCPECSGMSSRTIKLRDAVTDWNRKN